MFRGLIFAGATLLTLGLAAPAQAQSVVGGYCGEMTWQGQPAVDVWVSLRPNNTWATSEDGALAAMGEGSYSQSGSMLSMTGGESPRYQINANLFDDRIVGEVTASDGVRGVISMTRMRGTGSGLRSSALPPNFVVTSAERALAGDMRGLLEAMSWGWTPQGVEYWRTIYQSGTLPDHATDALRDWIRRAQAGERPVCDAQ